MSKVDELIHQATTLVRVGNKAEAKKILLQVVKQEPRNARAWYLLSQVADTQEQSVYCLNKVLEIDPFNKPARMWLKSIMDEKVETPPPQPPEQRQTKGTNFLPIVFLVIVIIIIIVVGWGILNFGLI